MQWLSQIYQSNPDLWQNNEGFDYPFLSPEFLSALEDSRSIGGHSGWIAHYLSNSQSAAEQEWIIPAFIKHHSYGEYVFDWSWANAYEQHGFDYYPKLLIAAPFTPAMGPRGFSDNDLNLVNRLPEIEQHCLEEGFSSAHYLFANEEDQKILNQSNWHKREGVQFHWFNRNYTEFDHYLSHFKSRKRKTVKKERLSITQQKLAIKHKTGKEITEEDWRFFYACYQSTYLKRGMQGYLNQKAFELIAQSMPEQVILMLAYSNDSRPIACALYFKDSHTLYGRYWGCIEETPNLHFELCYYQGIDYCIKQGLKRFDPGTQGEHKISRGFEPVSTYSYHWIAHPDFSRAIGDFVREEAKNVQLYKQECQTHLPFNQQQPNSN